ncbi:MAG: ThiF family adenylyltransferase [Dehalococcoidales bacterium]|nr:ThiF family adenylyltransferase [Dehalococcoidales bacterium]
MTYYLSNDFTRYRYTVVLVGCGGTGGYAAEGLCRILPAQAQLALIDFDRVEERNLVRQNFFRDEIGQIKSEVLAKRLSRKYNRAVAYSVLPIGMAPLKSDSLVIGCVDNGPARRDIAKKFTASYNSDPAWWVDAGNAENSGQVLIGNRDGAPAYRREEKGDRFYYLPLPTRQRPELLREQPQEPGCADIPAQGPTINLSMAALVVEVVRRLIAGACPWIQLYLDMDLGTLQPVFATPEVIEDLAKNKLNKGG